MASVHVTEIRFFFQKISSKSIHQKTHTCQPVRTAPRSEPDVEAFQMLHPRRAMRTCHITAHEESCSALRSQDCAEGTRNPAPASSRRHPAMQKSNHSTWKESDYVQLVSNRHVAEGVSSLSPALQLCSFALQPGSAKSSRSNPCSTGPTQAPKIKQ